MQVFRISTTPYEEDDFFIMTDLHADSIVAFIQPIVINQRRIEEELYDNESLVEGLRKQFPKSKVIMLTDFQTLSF